jgi:hypothetical protein
VRRAAARAAAALALAALAHGAAGAAAEEVGRYRFSSRADAGTFVLDTVTGRVWRYDRGDDAWYLYDLEAVARGGRTRPAESPAPPPTTPPPTTDVPTPAPPAAVPPAGPERPGGEGGER